MSPSRIGVLGKGLAGRRTFVDAMMGMADFPSEFRSRTYISEWICDGRPRLLECLVPVFMTAFHHGPIESWSQDPTLALELDFLKRCDACIFIVDPQHEVLGLSFHWYREMERVFHFLDRRDFKPLIVVTKIDLVTDTELYQAMKTFTLHGRRPLAISSKTGEGIEEAVEQVLNLVGI